MKREDSKQTIYKTYDYDRFQILGGNRAINRGHVKNLIASISQNNLLKENPILVDKSYTIIDGQHRWAAAKQIGEALYFTMVNKAGLDEVRLLNAYTTRWSLQDFLASYVKEGMEDYKKVDKFVEDYGFSLSTTLALLGGIEFKIGGGSTGNNHNVNGVNNLTSQFKAGIYKVTHEQEARDFADFLMKLRSYTEPSVWKGRDFITAIKHTLETGSISEVLLLEKFHKLESPMKRQATVKSYLRDIEDMLNKHQTTKIRLF